MRPILHVSRTSDANRVVRNVNQLERMAAYVGIPSASARQRKEFIQNKLAKTRNLKKRAHLARVISQDVTNAELLFIHTKGSPVRGIPARPVIEPAIEAKGNKEPIDRELTEASRQMLMGRKEQAVQFLKRAGIAGQNAARKWFTDSRNHWAPNKPSTIRQKGSDRPLIDTGALRNSITSVVEED